MCDIKKSFARTDILYSDARGELLYMTISFRDMYTKERYLLYSILHNRFKGNVIYFSRFLSAGFLTSGYYLYSMKEFFDLHNREYFYTPHLFKEAFTYIQNICGKNLDSFTVDDQWTVDMSRFWLKENDMMNLVRMIENREKKECFNFTPDTLHRLQEFSQNVSEYINDEGILTDVMNEPFFVNVQLFKFIFFLYAKNHFSSNLLLTY